MQMKDKLILLILIMATFCACSDNSKKQPVAITTADSTFSECYSFISDRDSITLRLVFKDSLVTGNLDYNFFEKDKNTGVIEGKVKGDTIIAEYTFMSEGMQSAREVAFLRKGNSMLEGFGGVEDINGKTIFKDRSVLVFDTANTLSRIDCNAFQ
jgi:hypothetical protein